MLNQMLNQRRGSSQLSNVSEAGGLVLSPSMMQVDMNANILTQNSPTTKNKDTTAAVGNYGNLVQTKAQQNAQNPDLAYVKRHSTSDRNAQANSQRRSGVKKSSIPTNQAITMPLSTTQQHPVAVPNSKAQNVNVDLAHMSLSFDMTGAKNGKFQQQQQNQEQNGPWNQSGGQFQGTKGFNPQQTMIKSPEIVITQSKLNSSKSPQHYARFRLQEHIKMLAQPKNVPICGPRLRELSNVVFEQQVADKFNTKNSHNLRTNQQSRRVEESTTINENFKSPHHMAAQFRSYKVGEKVGEKASEEIIQATMPYYAAPVVMPSTYRPHSHYNRATQEQMTTSLIIRSEAQKQNSTQKLFQPQSLRDQGLKQQRDSNSQLTIGNRRNTQNHHNSANNNQFGIEVQGDGNGLASLVIAGGNNDSQRQNKIYQTQNAYDERMLSNKQSLNADYAEAQNIGQMEVPSSRLNSGRSKQSGNLALHRAQQRSKRIMTARSNHSMNAPTALKSRNQSAAQVSMKLPRTRQSSTIQGDELVIKRNMMFNQSSAVVTRQQRLEAHESLQHHKQFVKDMGNQKRLDQEKQMVDHQAKDRGGSILRKEPFPISNQSALDSPYSKIQETSIDNNNNKQKNVTVIDRLMPKTTQQITEIMASQTLTPKKNNTLDLGSHLIDESMVNASQDSVKQQNQRNKQTAQRDSKQQVGPQQSEFDPALAANRSSQVTPQAETLHQSALFMNQFQTQADLQSANYKKQCIADLKSFSSEELTMMARNVNKFKPNGKVSGRNNVKNSTMPVCSVDMVAGNKQNVYMSRSKMARMRQEARRQKISLTRQNSLNSTGQHSHSCRRCTDQEIESTKKLIDQGHRDSSRSKVYFKPSVVQIQDETGKTSTSKRGGDANLNSSTERSSIQNQATVADLKSYLLGPNVSQDHINLGSIREESQTMGGVRASIDSYAMQAMFGYEDGMPNIGEFEVNPETREFILYLQQVQPDLLLQQQPTLTTVEGIQINPGSPQFALNQPANSQTLKIDQLSVLEQKRGFVNKQDTMPIINHGQMDLLVEPKERETNVIVEENSVAFVSSIALGDMADTERRNNQDPSKQVLNSIETLGQIPRNGSDTHVILHSSDDEANARDMIDIRRDLNQEDESEDGPEDTLMDEQKQQEINVTTLEDEPVNYQGQINMMQNIFKQISDQRAQATRTTVKNQKVIFQPTLREFRRLDFKPLNVDDRRYPPGSIDRNTPEQRPADKPKAPLFKHRIAKSHRANPGRDSPQSFLENNKHALLKLKKVQLGKEGQFASLLNRKRNDKNVTWDTEPPVIHQIAQQYQQQDNSYYSQNSRTYGDQTTGNSYYYDEEDYRQHPVYLQYENEIIHEENQQLAQQTAVPQEQVPQGHDTQNQQRMSPIKEVSSVSRLDEATTIKSSQQGNPKQSSRTEGASYNPSLDDEIRQVTKMMYEKKSALGSQKGKKVYPHREGKPIAPDLSMSLGGSHTSANKTEEQKKPDEDTFMALFYNKDEAEAFKKGKNPGRGEIIDRTETIEWSQRESKPLQQKDELGQPLTHRGNVIMRGFNVAQQRKTRIVSTNDPSILANDNLKRLFDDSKHKITNYMSELGPPTKKTSDLTNQQWKRIKRAQFKYDNLDEKKPAQQKTTKAEKKYIKQKQQGHRSSLSSAIAKNLGANSHDSSSAQAAATKVEDDQKQKIAVDGEDEKDQVIEGNIFSFTNPDRYKTDQLKEQAMALLVPGYLNYIYDIN